jgi:hypothetical protein
MTTIAITTVLTSTAFRHGAERVRGVEKSATHGQFDGECETPRKTQVTDAAASAPRTSCQSGTGKSASFWNGPRIRPAFAAQVIAQATAKPAARPVSAYTAYRQGAVGVALLVDRNL